MVVHVVPASVDEHIHIVQHCSVLGDVAEVRNDAKGVTVIGAIMWNPQLLERLVEEEEVRVVSSIDVDQICVVF